MSKNTCTLCNSSKADLQCGICNCTLCKNCAIFSEDADFSFMTTVPDDLKHTTYCNICYDNKVMPELDKYNQMMEQAKEVIVFDKSQGKESRLLKRTEKQIHVSDCNDREETLLRLAFKAVQIGCNAIVDVELRSKTVRKNSYQTTAWSGTAIPTKSNPRR